MPYFHISRFPESFVVGQLIQLESCEHLLQEHSIQKQFLDDFLTGGLSAHGKNYLMTSQAGGSVTREYVAELVRREYFPQLPSRFQCLFGWEFLEHGEQFVTDYIARKQQVGEQIFDIWIVDSKRGIHVGDMAHFSGGQTWMDAFASAKAYWEGAMTQNPLPEVLLPLPVSVVGHAGKIVCWKRETYGTTRKLISS
ncbi:MAG: DUF2441 domain-containing protein [Caldilineaceae bacterium]|nr:DUF2441 domain-containing protein [Caldilineaceae bacterium]